MESAAAKVLSETQREPGMVSVSHRVQKKLLWLSGTPGVDCCSTEKIDLTSK